MPPEFILGTVTSDPSYLTFKVIFEKGLCVKMQTSYALEIF